ncbi:MAG: HD domain-containing protein [Tyzzerella sp.]|nr:HD domain-containing protein [Tyzzerella sp.]
MAICYDEIKKNEEILNFIRKGNANLGVLGFTDHSEAHTCLVAERAAYILSEMGYSEHEQELVKIAGFMHDIGNAINRKNHAEYGGLLADAILKNMDISIEDRVTIVSAIAHHDESTGGATDVVSAALIIADKTDVRQNRVTEKDKTAFDIHDRVNYAVIGNRLVVNVDDKKITLELKIDESICTMYEYFDIFLGRMLLSRAAAEMLGAKFSLRVNGNKVL